MKKFEKKSITFSFTIFAATCEVEGIVHHDLELFRSGNDSCAECTCHMGRVYCDGSICQTLSTTQNNVLIRNRRDVSDYVNMTSELASHVDDHSPTNRDFRNIVEDIGRELAKNAYQRVSNKLSKVGPPCIIPTIMSYVKYQRASRSLTDISYRVANLAEKRFVSSQHMLNKIEIYSSEVSVANNSTLQQEASTLSYALTVTKTDTMATMKTSNIKSNDPIMVPFVGTSGLPIEFTGNDYEINKRVQKFTIEAPTQKVLLDPFTKMRMRFIFYQYETRNDFRLDFLIDKNSTMTCPDFERDLFYGDPKCCEPCYLFQQNDTITTSLNEFIADNPKILDTIQYQNEDAIHLAYNDFGQLTLTNFPSIEKIMNFGVDILFEAPEQIVN